MPEARSAKHRAGKTLFLPRFTAPRGGPAPVPTVAARRERRARDSEGESDAASQSVRQSMGQSVSEDGSGAHWCFSKIKTHRGSVALWDSNHLPSFSRPARPGPARLGLVRSGRVRSGEPRRSSCTVFSFLHAGEQLRLPGRCLEA